MKKAALAFFSCMLAIYFSGCTADSPAYHSVVGTVEVEASGKTITPVANYLYSTDWMNEGWICGDGMSLFNDGDELQSVVEEKKATISKIDVATVNVSGKNGYADWYSFYGMDRKQLGDGKRLKEDRPLELPDQPESYFVCLHVTWTAERSPPGQTKKENIVYEYIFLVR